MISEVSPAIFPLIRTSRGLTATASARSPLASEMRWMFMAIVEHQRLAHRDYQWSVLGL